MEECGLRGQRTHQCSVLAHSMEHLLLLTLLEEGEKEAEVFPTGSKCKGCGT